MPLDLRTSYSKHILRAFAEGFKPLSKRAFIRTAAHAYIGLPRR